MIEYFKLIDNFLKDNGEKYKNKSIKDLTIDLAKSGGYYRDVYIFKCGTKRERTLYKNKFDSTLVALWLSFYKKLFYSKLSKYPQLSDYYNFIINKTFFITMSCINLDKLTHDDIINKYVNMALDSRIKEVLGKIKKSDNLNIKVNKKEIFNNSMLPLDIVDFYYEDQKQSLDSINLELEIREKLANNDLGNRLLDCLLYSYKKVELNKIDKYMILSKDECTEENKVVIANAYNIIKYMLIQYTNSKKRFREVSSNNIKYSFEE